jgi:hypothetical protein
VEEVHALGRLVGDLDLEQQRQLRDELIVQQLQRVGRENKRKKKSHALAPLLLKERK